MICLFCNKTINYHVDIYHVCLICNIDYYFPTTLNNYNYGHANMKLKDIRDIKHPYFQFLLIPRTPYSRIVGTKGETIAEWNYMPNINPSNINDKLKLYMLFS